MASPRRPGIRRTRGEDPTKKEDDARLDGKRNEEVHADADVVELELLADVVKRKRSSYKIPDLQIRRGNVFHMFSSPVADNGDANTIKGGDGYLEGQS